MNTLKELLNELYQAKAPLERHKLNQELIKALSSSGVSYEEAKEFVDALEKLIHEHRYYKQVVTNLRNIFEKILS
ncbi:MAG: hypothetical protein P3W91_001065 [Fervidobacterium sp.]|nr:hypothetical protein [Fervidobacterium sp.]